MVDTFKEFKNAPNSRYYELKYKFNYYSNKIEGSTFTLENILNLMHYGIVEGRHKFDDVVETRNSLQLFDYVIENLGENLSKGLLLEYHSILKRHTKDDSRGLCGCFKKVPNMILGNEREFAQPSEVERVLEKLFEWYRSLDKVTLREIAEFHLRFETIHPFQDGNGRIGRFLMLKQCIENDINPVMITGNDVQNYRNSMAKDIDILYEFLRLCSRYDLNIEFGC